MSMEVSHLQMSLTVNVFFSSNIHSGIIACSVSFLKLGIVSLTKLDGKPVFQYFSLIFHISLSKLDVILFAL